MFVNSLPRKWISMNQTQRANNSIKNDSLATLYGKYNYEEGLFDQIYESETQRFTIRASSSKALITNNQFQGSDSDVEEDLRSSSEFIADLNAEYHECSSNKTSTPSYPSSNKSSTPSYPSSNKSYNKPKPFTHTSPQNSDNHQKDYKGKYKGLKAEIAVLTIKIDAISKGNSEKGLVAESFDWDEESVSSKDEGTTKVKEFMAIAEEEPSVEKADARSVPRNIVKALGGRGKRKEKISSKEVIFTKADESSSMSISEITSDSESKCETQEPLPPLPKLIGAEPAGTSNSLISMADLTLNMADLTLNTSVPKKTKPTSDKVSPTHAIKKNTKTKPPVVPAPIPEKKGDASAEHLLLTLMEEVKSLKEHIKVPSDNSPSVSQTRSSKSSKAKKASMIPKPFKDCKYCGFNDHHFDDYEYYPGCEICGSVAHEIANCPKKHPNNMKPRIANKRSTEPTKKYMTWVKQYLHKYSKESGPKVIFGDNSSGDAEGYGLVNCNGMTFIRVAYMNGLKHNLINISQLCDANFKILFTKTQETLFNQNNEVVLIYPRRRDVYVIDMSSYNEESNDCFFAKASLSTQETLFNQNDEVVLISPRRRDVYFIDMSSYNEESNDCFFAKALLSVNWL
ncbi:hypothetical protein Tco_1504212 [Tanacetum coccineum]